MTRRRSEAPELEKAIGRMMNALVKRCEEGELEALEALDRLEDESQSALTLGVLFYKTGPAQASWTTIGEILGISRQAAHQRFRFVETIEASLNGSLCEDQAEHGPHDACPGRDLRDYRPPWKRGTDED